MANKPENFKYKTVFNRCFVKASGHSDGDPYLSKANLDSLKALGLPDSIDITNNVDLLATILNAAVINRMNRNDDGIDGKTALAIKNQFLHKPTNLEHKRQHIVGHIVKAGWSGFQTNELLSDEDVAQMEDPFNLVLASVVYRLVSEKFSDALIDSTDESNLKYMSISASWELAFNDYHIILGSKNVKDAEVITDPKHIKELSRYLKAEGGAGVTPDNEYVGRLIISSDESDVLPLGIAYTEKPAAEVQGTNVLDFSDFIDDEEEQSNASQTNNEENDTNFENNQKKSSQNEELNVNTHNIEEKDMPKEKIKTYEDLEKVLSSEATASSVNEFIQEQIALKDEDWKKEVNKKEEKLNETKAELDKANQRIEELEGKAERIDELEQKIEKITSEAQAKENQRLFQERMNSLCEEYELGDKDREVIANEITNLSEDEYKSWYNKFSIFAREKSKEVLAKKEEEFNKKVKEAVASLQQSNASENETSTTEENNDSTPENNNGSETEEALNNTQETENQEVSNARQGEETKPVGAEKWREAFKDSIKIN